MGAVMGEPTTSEMVERLAQAIHDAWGDGYQGRWNPHAPHWPEVYRRIARAAIAAMREPGTAAMGGVAKHFAEDRDKHLHVGIWWEGHLAMIDAALANASPAAPELPPAADPASEATPISPEQENGPQPQISGPTRDAGSEGKP